MSLLDDLHNPPKRAVSFPEWLLRQTPEVRAALELAALDTETWSPYGLERVLRKHGAPVSKESILAWRADVSAR